MRRAIVAAGLVWLIASAASALEPPRKAAYVRLDAPGKDWTLVMRVDGFAVETPELSPDGKSAAIGAEDKARGMMVTVFIEPAAKEGDSKTAREVYRKRLSASPFKMEDATESKRGEWAVLEYMLKARGINQKHINAYMAKDGMWIDVHFSKGDYKSGDEARIYALIDGITFDASKPSLDECMLDGAETYLKRDYAGAIAPYSKALEMEKKTPTLSKHGVRVLVDNLGIAYVMTGDLADAKTTFEYGISREGNYPMFHYDLACTYAEMGKLDEAIASLKTAFKFRANMIPGETMPDPRTDSSFVKYLQNEKFQKALKEIEAQKRDKPRGKAKPAGRKAGP